MSGSQLHVVPLGLSLVGALLAGCALLRIPQESTTQATPPVATISNRSEARWTPTTWESVSTPVHRKMLARGRPTTIVGEVVDVSCFLQLGKRGEAHIPCGQKCVRNGQPVGILTEKGQLYLVIPEEHHPRRDGQVNVRDRFAELMGKRVIVNGMAMKYNGYRTLFVQTLPSES